MVQTNQPFFKQHTSMEATAKSTDKSNLCESLLTRTSKRTLRRPELNADLPVDIILTIMSFDSIIHYACRQTCTAMMAAVIAPDVRDDIYAAANSGNIELYDMLSGSLKQSPTHYCYRVNNHEGLTPNPADLFCASNLSTETLISLITKYTMSTVAITIMIVSNRDDASILIAHLMNAQQSDMSLRNVKILAYCALDTQNVLITEAVINGSKYPIKIVYTLPSEDDENTLYIRPTDVEDSLCPRNIQMLRWHLDRGAMIRESRVRNAKSAEVIEVLRQYGYKI